MIDDNQNRLLLKTETGWTLDTPLPNLPLRDRHLSPQEEEARDLLSPKDLIACEQLVQEGNNLLSSWYPQPANLPTPWIWANTKEEGKPSKIFFLDDIEHWLLCVDGFSSAALVEETRKAVYRWLGAWRSLLRDYSGAFEIALSMDIEKPLTF